jgi:hypothetical protein
LGTAQLFHHAIQLEPKIEMQITRRVFLHDEAQLPPRSLFYRLARRLRGLREIAFAFVLGERLCPRGAFASRHATS